MALAVADGMHHHGVGTLLLEHLVSLARARGVRAFRAETLAVNGTMLRLLGAAGLPVRRDLADGVVEVTMPLTANGPYLDAVAERERHADVESGPSHEEGRATGTAGLSALTGRPPAR